MARSAVGNAERCGARTRNRRFKRDADYAGTVWRNRRRTFTGREIRTIGSCNRHGRDRQIDVPFIGQRDTLRHTRHANGLISERDAAGRKLGDGSSHCLAQNWRSAGREVCASLVARRDAVRACQQRGNSQGRDSTAAEIGIAVEVLALVSGAYRMKKTFPAVADAGALAAADKER